MRRSLENVLPCIRGPWAQQFENACSSGPKGFALFFRRFRIRLAVYEHTNSKCRSTTIKTGQFNCYFFFFTLYDQLIRFISDILRERHTTASINRNMESWIRTSCCHTNLQQSQKWELEMSCVKTGRNLTYELSKDARHHHFLIPNSLFSITHVWLLRRCKLTSGVDKVSVTKDVDAVAGLQERERKHMLLPKVAMLQTY